VQTERLSWDDQVEYKDIQLSYQFLNEGVLNNQAGANSANNITFTYIESNINNNSSMNQPYGLKSISVSYSSSQLANSDL